MTAPGDFLVIGSGVAGLRAALGLADAGQVVVLTKADPGESSTGYAQGGIAAALGDDDSPALHAHDTIAAGDQLCVPDAVHVLVEEGCRYVEELLGWGARFDRDADGRLSLGREAAHSVRRVLHAGDATGREIGRVLWSRVFGHPRIRVIDDAQVVSLGTRDGVCTGASYLHNGAVRHVEAARTLLATGGAGQVFRETTNPGVATGDGIAMAFEAGARVADLEFVQFHPTVLHVAGAPRFLLSEALRGEGAWLVNEAGERFVLRDEPAGELAPRDVVARAIVREQARTRGSVYLTLSHLEATYVRARFPTITSACARVGLDLAADRIPVSPAAHYMMGGVETDLHGRTSIEGLFAAGEVACTGIHGANRLASNSLLEGLVFGARAAVAMRQPLAPGLFTCDAAVLPSPRARTGVAISTADVRELMWRQVGLVRSGDGLREAVARLAQWRCPPPAAASIDPARHRTAVLATVGFLIAHAALRREESRGGHVRADFPHHDDQRWRRHAADVKGSASAAAPCAGAD